MGAISRISHGTLLCLEMSVENKVCIITGSAQGLGKAFAVRLLTAGARVCISDLKRETGEKTLAELKERFGDGKVCFVACDVTDEDQFKNLFNKAEEFFKVSCVDILVNNAGINTNFGWKKCMEVNIMAVMMGTEIAMERMRKSPNKGQIINVASMAGLAPGLGEEMVGYTVSKTGVIALTRTMAKDIARHGVVTKCICPSWTDTEIVTNVTPGEGKDMIDKTMKKMNGTMTPEHVAEGFYRLTTQYENGSAMAVIKGVPYFLVPDYNVFPMIMSMVMMAKVLDKIFEPQVVIRDLQIAGFIVACMLLVVFIAWMF